MQQANILILVRPLFRALQSSLVLQVGYRGRKKEEKRRGSGGWKAGGGGGGGGGGMKKKKKKEKKKKVRCDENQELTRYFLES